MEKQVLGQPKELNTRVRNKMTEENKKQEIEKEITKTEKIVETPKPEEEEEETKKEEKKPEEKPEPKEKPKIQAKKPVKPVVKKTEAVVNSRNLPISTKHSIAICKFIRNKKIVKAIDDLEQVLKHKKVIPMKGEIPHRKGKGIMSGRYLNKATGHFIRLLKSLLANSNNNELDDPIIVEAIANIASRPFGRFGRMRRKRTHVRIVAKKKKSVSKNKKPKEKK